MIDRNAKTPMIAKVALGVVLLIVVSEVLAALIGGMRWMVIVGVAVSIIAAISFVVVFVWQLFVDR